MKGNDNLRGTEPHHESSENKFQYYIKYDVIVATLRQSHAPVSAEVLVFSRRYTFLVRGRNFIATHCPPHNLLSLVPNLHVIIIKQY